MCVGKWNDLFRAAGGNVDEYAAGRDQAIMDGEIKMHECGDFLMFATTNAAIDAVEDRPRHFNCRLRTGRRLRKAGSVNSPRSADTNPANLNRSVILLSSLLRWVLK
jgi:hypothetical protein